LPFSEPRGVSLGIPGFPVVKGWSVRFTVRTADVPRMRSTSRHAIAGTSLREYVSRWVDEPPSSGLAAPKPTVAAPLRSAIRGALAIRDCHARSRPPRRDDTTGPATRQTHSLSRRLLRGERKTAAKCDRSVPRDDRQRDVRRMRHIMHDTLMGHDERTVALVVAAGVQVAVVLREERRRYRHAKPVSRLEHA
jgi:hypothetical protein